MISGESETPRVGQPRKVGVVLEPGMVLAMMHMLMHLGTAESMNVCLERLGGRVTQKR